MTPEFLTEDVKAAFASFAETYPNQEVCALILKDGTVVESLNTIEGSGITENGEELTVETGAMVGVDLLMEHDGNIGCSFHSHWDEMTPGYLSFIDIQQSQLHDIPALLYHTAFKVWDYYDPNYYHPAPLLEKQTSKTNINYYLDWKFEYGRSDCSALLRSYYYNHFGLEIPDYSRPPDGEWYLNPQHTTAYQDLLGDPSNGFVSVNTSKPKKHDLVLVKWFGSRHASHAGIMVEDDKVLHIIKDQPSKVVVWGGAWQRGLHSVWRLANS